MLFNSIEFLFFFLPITLSIFLALKNFGYGKSAMVFIGLASLFFYGWWDIRYLALLLTSVILNYYIGRQLSKKHMAKFFLILGISGNIICLAWFKYFNFFLDNLNYILSYNVSVEAIILPLGISFFTFQQIAYLVDAYKGKTEESNFIEYLVFVTFFPQLIAGPIVHHKTMMPQFHNHSVTNYNWTKSCIGLLLFSFGLFKKVMIADTLAGYGSPIYSAAELGNSISFIEGWAASLSYTLQLYFDFSGYSDMAIGLGLLFGIRIPNNFFSPYKATNIIDFWKRWHITLSTFLKDYLYIPLGGNRHGKSRRYINLMITMLLGGLWHGANWTFVLWGALHGIYLIINHAWRKVFPSLLKGNVFVTILSWFITIIAVVVSWVIFRCENISAAFEILSAMFGMNSLSFPKDDGSIGALQSLDVFYIIAVCTLLVLFAPNGLQIISAAEGMDEKKWHSFTLNKKWLTATVIILSVTLYFIVYHMNRISEFIYFQF